MTEDISGTQSSLTLRCNQKGSWRIRVRTKGLHSDWGAWSSYVPFVVADLPQAWVANPGVDGALVDSAPLNVEVSASDETGIASATLSLTRPDGTVVGSVDVTDLRPVPIGSYEALENGVTYTLTLHVRLAPASPRPQGAPSRRTGANRPSRSSRSRTTAASPTTSWPRTARPPT